jgi:hypothetical protein
MEALRFGRRAPLAGDEVKIVWHIEGVGPLRVVATAPDGRGVPLVFGPDDRGFDPRTTGEWGTGFRFDQAGCWHIHLARDDVTGDAWISVAEAIPGVESTVASVSTRP